MTPWPYERENVDRWLRGEGQQSGPWVTRRSITLALTEPDATFPDRWYCEAGVIEADPLGQVSGEQTVWLDDRPLSPADARELAAALMTCAELVDPQAQRD